MNRQLKLLLSVIVTSVMLLGSGAVIAEQISEDSLTALLRGLCQADYAQPLEEIVPPEWPSDAPDTAFKAKVFVRIMRNHDGSVDSVETVYCSSPHLCFINEAMDAARRTVFSISDKFESRFPDWKYYAYEFWAPEYPNPDGFVEIDESAERIHFGVPVYPRLAEQSGVTGTVWVKALISRTGTVSDVLVFKSSGDESLDRAGVVAAFESKFKPAMKDGKPVATWVAWPYKFEL